MNDRIAVIVDGHSTGALLAPAFAAFGINAVHVENRAEQSAAHLRTFAPENYLDCLSFGGDWAALLTELKPYHVGWVVAGTDSGTGTADRLAELLGLTERNPADSSAARRDKLAMQQALREADVPTAWFAAARSPLQARRLAAEHGGTVVVKPLRSGGTDGVSVCHDPEQVARAVEALTASRTIYGELNDVVLLQEHLDGDEYMVNTISADGRHRVAEVWRSAKTLVGSAPVYDYTELVTADQPGVGPVIDYVRSVLDALDIRWGPAHTEVIVTTDGPRLVETAPRLQGTLDISATARATGCNLVADTVHALVDPAFLTLAAPCDTPLLRPILGVSFICPVSGTLRSDLDWARMRSLPSFHSLLAPVGRAGDAVRRTSDLFTRPGALYLVHTDRAVLERDHATIRAWERNGFYDVEPDRT